jgi:8-oxo-dGTP diphosphatase
MGLDIVLVAACALLDADGRVLLAKRPQGRPLAGLWEFPGGKVEPGETPEGALVRELEEELGITVDPKCLAPLTFASHTYEAFHLLMPLYVCRTWRGEVRAQQGQEFAWVPAKRLASYQMPPADEPLKAVLRDVL